MTQPQQSQRPTPGPLVEDTTVEGGYDTNTGQAVIRPKPVQGQRPQVTEQRQFKPTDSRD